jgi:hypothetical protein
MEARICPTCATPWHSSGWRTPVRVRCDCGTALNLAEAQLDPQLVDECKAIAEELQAYFATTPSTKGTSSTFG